jgi:hypothetical protein
LEGKRITSLLMVRMPMVQPQSTWQKKKSNEMKRNLMVEKKIKQTSRFLC